MWSSEEKIRNGKMAAVADTGYYPGSGKKQESRKCSRAMAMILGLIATVEIMIAGAMILNVDFHTADMIAVIMAFTVVYSAVVAVLTDK